MVNKKAFIIAAVAITILVVGLGIYGLISSNKKPVAQDTSTYIDPGTGKELVSDMPLTQEPADNPDPSRPIFIGFSTLTDRGLSRSQQAQVENAIYSYSSQQSLNFEEISLTTSSIETTPPGSEEPGYYVQFMITVNRSKQYFVKVSYTDFTSSTTEIYDQSKMRLLFTQ